MIRETLRDDSETGIGHKQINPDDWKVRCGYPWMLFNWICLCSSLFLCSRTLTLVVVDSWFKMESFLHKMAISFEKFSSWREESFFLCRMTWFTTQFCSFAQTLCCVVCSSLSLSSSVALVPLCPWVGLGPPLVPTREKFACWLRNVRSIGVDDSFVVGRQGAGQKCLWENVRPIGVSRMRHGSLESVKNCLSCNRNR